MYLGLAKYFDGNLREAERLLMDRIAPLKQTGDSLHLLMCHHHLRHLYSVQGHSEKARHHASLEVAIGEALNEPDMVCWGSYGLADANARMGKLAEAHLNIERALTIAGTGNRMLSKSIVLNHQSFVLIQSSRYREAVAVLEQALRFQERKLLLLDFMMPAYPLLIESLVGPNWLDERNDVDMRRARTVSRCRCWLVSRFANHFPHFLRCQGRLHCALGNRRKAAGKFQQSLVAARELDSDYHIARALLDLSAVDQARCDELRDEAVTILRRIKGVIPRAEIWQLGNNLDETCVAPELEGE